jgi:hypothetical protein
MFYQGKSIGKEEKFTNIKLKLHHVSMAIAYQKAALGELWRRRQM